MRIHPASPLALLGLLGLLTGCALTNQDGRPRLILPRVCPDGAPIRFLQHPSCGRACGWSCLPDRWREPVVEPGDP